VAYQLRESNEASWNFIGFSSNWIHAPRLSC